MKDLHERTKNTKLLEENTEGKLHDAGFGNDFLAMTSETQPKKDKKLRSWILSKLNFCESKNTTNRVKRKPMEIFASHTSDKGLIFRVYEEFLQVNNKETNTSIKKLAKDLNRHFSKEDIQMANKHLKRCSISLEKCKSKPQ